MSRLSTGQTNFLRVLARNSSTIEVPTASQIPAGALRKLRQMAAWGYIEIVQATQDGAPIDTLHFVLTSQGAALADDLLVKEAPHKVDEDA